MEENNDNPPQEYRFHVDGVRKTNIVEWNKKRKLQSDLLDLLRAKHKCWVGSSSSEHASMFDENPELERAHNAAAVDDVSEPESAKHGNSFIEDSDTAMSVEADCSKTYLYGRPSTSSFNWVYYNNYSLISTAERVDSSGENTFVDTDYDLYYHNADIQALKNSKEHLHGLESCSDNIYSEYAKDSSEQSLDKEFEDILYSNGVNPKMYVLSSGRRDVSQEAQSSTWPLTIDQEFEQYFSMLML